MRVYHLTNAMHAVSNIALRRLKVSRFEDLNDPFELIGADLKDKVERTAFRELKRRLHEKYGVLCFSKSWSNPVLWSHYADKHRGVCLGFDIEDSEAREIIYTEKPLKMKFASQRARPLMLTKYVDWRYEEEVRIILELNRLPVEGGLYFSLFSPEMELREVILGPRCSLEQNVIADLCKKLNDKIEVKKARLAFSSFRVIEKLLAKKQQDNT